MRKFGVSLVLVLLTLLPITLSGQSKFDGFFKPVTSDIFLVKADVEQAAVPSVWLFRPSVTVVATMFKIDTDEASPGGLVASPLAKAGVGMSYAHYVEGEGGLPYNNYAINAMLLFPTDGATNLAVAATVSAFQYINVGVGYDIIKGPFKENFFILTGVQLTF